MSCLPAVSASPSYRFTLEQAQNVYDESSQALKEALHDKTVEGSIAEQIDHLNSRVKQINETPKDASDFPALKAQFIRFMKTQLSKLEVVQKVHDEGLKAIKIVTDALASCSKFNPDLLQEESLRLHLAGLGINIVQLGQKQAEIAGKIANYPFKEQLAELSESVQKVAEQLSVLEMSLNNAFLAKFTVEGTVERCKMYVQNYGNPYLIAALVEKDQQMKGKDL